MADHVVGGVEPAEVAGGFVDARAFLLDEIRLDAEAGEAVQNRRTEQVVAFEEFARELVGGSGDGVGDIAVVVVVDAAAAGLSAGDVDASRFAVGPIDRLGSLAVAHREATGRPPVEPDGPGAAAGGGFGGHLVQGHVQRAGAGLLTNETPLPVSDVRIGHGSGFGGTGKAVAGWDWED